MSVSNIENPGGFGRHRLVVLVRVGATLAGRHVDALGIIDAAAALR